MRSALIWLPSGLGKGLSFCWFRDEGSLLCNRWCAQHRANVLRLVKSTTLGFCRGLWLHNMLTSCYVWIWVIMFWARASEEQSLSSCWQLRKKNSSLEGENQDFWKEEQSSLLTRVQIDGGLCSIWKVPWDAWKKLLCLQNVTAINIAWV